MTTFYLVRHGETENNVNHRLSGWIDTPLTPNGLLPTERVVEKIKDIKFDEIYSSDVGRAFMTAYFIVRQIGFSKEILRVPGLREVNYGEAANMKTEAAYALYPRLDRDTHFTPPGGESLDAMQARVLQTVAKLDAAHPGATNLLVAHSGVMAALKASLTGQDFGEHNISEAYVHDFVAKITYDNGKLQLFEPVL